jgi:predicted nucleotidyltransferase
MQGCLLLPNLGMIMPKMGTKRRATRRRAAASHSNVADALFTGTQQRVLALLFGQPNRSFYGSELISLAKAGSGAVQRELAKLSESGLVTVTKVGSQKHYQANPKSPIYAELHGITQKTVGLAEPLRNALAPLAQKVRAVFIYGSVAKRQDTAASDIDLMVLSDELSYGDVFAVLEEAGQRLGRTVNPTILTHPEFRKRMKRKDAFLTRVLAQPKIWLIGNEDDLAV